jgi:predicted choloylglycine hydrolase
MNNTARTIQPGQTLTARSACDYECIFRVTVIERKNSFATVKVMGSEKRVKINKDSCGNEFVYAMGKHSMAPVFRA